MMYVMLSPQAWLTRYSKETPVQRTAFARIAAVAISALMLLPAASSCSTPAGNRSQPAIPPTTPSTPTQVISLQPNSNGSMERANVQGTGVFVTKGVQQLTGLKW